MHTQLSPSRLSFALWWHSILPLPTGATASRQRPPQPITSGIGARQSATINRNERIDRTSRGCDDGPSLGRSPESMPARKRRIASSCATHAVQPKHSSGCDRPRRTDMSRGSGSERADSASLTRRTPDYSSLAMRLCPWVAEDAGRFRAAAMGSGRGGPERESHE